MHNSDGALRRIEVILLYSENQSVQLHVDQQQQQQWSIEKKNNTLSERCFDKL